jgi:hypothetical protein
MSELDDIMGAVPVASTIYGIGKAILGPSQEEQQQKLQNQQIQGAEQLGAFNQKLQLDTWNKTNYEAQVQHIKAAGLNPALLYGKGGGGGATTGSAQAQLPNAPTAPSDLERTQAATGMGMQLANMRVMNTQAEANQAQANLANTQAAKLSGVDTGKVQADTANTQVDTILKQAQATIASAQATHAEGNAQNQYSILNSQANQAINEATSSMIKANIDQETQDATIQKIKQDAINKGIEAIAMQQNIKLDQAKIDQITTGIQQKWQEINISQSKNEFEHGDRLKAIEEYTKNALQVAGIIGATNVIRDVVGIATKGPNKGVISTTTNGNGETIKENWTRPIQ